MIAYPTQNTRKQTIVELRNRIRAWERRSPQSTTACMSTGCDALDALFPGHGIRRGSLVEWVGDGDASGAGTLSLLVGRRFCETDRPAILVDFQQQIYPRGIVRSSASISRRSLWSIPIPNERHFGRAKNRCVARRLLLFGQGSSISRDIAFRRLQLAAEESGGVGFFVRSTAALNEPSWADVRLLVTPRPASGRSPCFRMTVAYSHGKPCDPGCGHRDRRLARNAP